MNPPSKDNGSVLKSNNSSLIRSSVNQVNIEELKQEEQPLIKEAKREDKIEEDPF